ncbi:MAG: 4-hydroxybenzoate octaprenyltransferase [Xanthomonadaceae bacterium]|nr:4-hydroxybenzoate octaprenyltransferase [Xanthomonadaceae bacterium]
MRRLISGIERWYAEHPQVERALLRALERAEQYWLLMRFNRPIGILLLLWPTLWALWIAGDGRPDPKVFVVFVVGVVLMRAAGCTINDYADRKFDPHVARTRDRPIASGRVTPREALALFAVLGLTAFVLVLTMNRLTVLLALIGAALAASYPFMKRWTWLPQPYLGAAFGWAIPMAFAAQTGSVPPVAWVLFISTVLWATVYDTQYAMVDRDDDVRVGIRSTAILFGDNDRTIIALLQVTTLFGLLLAGQRAGLGGWYLAALGAGAVLFAWQQWLIRKRDRDGCFRAFLNNNWFGLVVFVGILLHYLFL